MVRKLCLEKRKYLYVSLCLQSQYSAAKGRRVKNLRPAFLKFEDNLGYMRLYLKTNKV